MRRRLGPLFVTLGTVLLLAALSLFVYNRWDALRAENAARTVEEYLESRKEDETAVPGEVPPGWEGYDVPPDGIMPTIEIAGYEYIGTLSIPRFGLELPIMSEWSYPGLKIAPGRYAGSVWTDDMVICGHNYERHFGNLRYLEAGDSVRFTDVLDNVFYYEVTEVVILAPTAIEEMTATGAFESESGDWDLTLFTCTIGGRTRVTVRCRRLEFWEVEASGLSE